jgi:DNA-binding transcriptional MerR regulator
MKKELDLKAEVYTAKSLAELWNVSSRLIHYYRNVGKLKSSTAGTARYYYKKEDIEEFLKSKGYE